MNFTYYDHDNIHTWPFIIQNSIHAYCNTACINSPFNKESNECQLSKQLTARQVYNKRPVLTTYNNATIMVSEHFASKF